MKLRIKEQGSAVHIIIIVILVIALLGVLGFVFWQNFVNKNTISDANKSTQTNSQSTSQKATCATGQDENATNGVFCSEVYGVSFTVPDEFKGQLQKSENTSIYPVSDVEPEALGETESVITAKVTRGQYDYVLTISLLPQINNMSLGLLGGGQFDSSDKKLYSIESSAENPALHRGGEYPSVTSKNGVKVYRETYGDVGYLIYKSAIIVGDKVVVIDLRDNPNLTEGFPDEIPTVDDEVILATLTLL